MKRFQHKGFTLVELMLVVVIIGILVGMVVPRIAGRAEQARQAAAKADIEVNIASALDLYNVDNGFYPETLDEFLTNTKSLPAWKGPYLKKKPIDPWGTPYDYKYFPEDNSYTLRSFGKDRQEGASNVISSADQPKAP
ncbi:MAG: type II secretion system major pseudopilin GspG [Candidatus Omnitrophica bacterium]|nr:type II secretion system major pseudopilin GspG [Candidatus Omnitrophota bacterium]